MPAPGVRVTEVDLSGGSQQGSPGVKSGVKDQTGSPPRRGAPAVKVTERDLSKK